jgi:hypothetical protein
VDQVQRSKEVFIHCAKCVSMRPAGKTMREYASIEVSIVSGAIVIRCKRHDELVASLRLHESAVKIMAGKACTCAECHKNVTDDVVGPVSAATEARDDGPLVQAVHDELEHLGIERATAMMRTDRLHNEAGHWAVTALGQAVVRGEFVAHMPNTSQEKQKEMAVSSAAIVFLCEELYPGPSDYLESLGLGEIVHEWKAS